MRYTSRDLEQRPSCTVRGNDRSVRNLTAEASSAQQRAIVAGPRATMREAAQGATAKHEGPETPVPVEYWVRAFALDRRSDHIKNQYFVRDLSDVVSCPCPSKSFRTRTDVAIRGEPHAGLERRALRGDHLASTRCRAPPDRQRTTAPPRAQSVSRALACAHVRDAMRHRRRTASGYHRCRSVARHASTALFRTHKIRRETSCLRPRPRARDPDDPMASRRRGPHAAIRENRALVRGPVSPGTVRREVVGHRRILRSAWPRWRGDGYDE